MITVHLSVSPLGHFRDQLISVQNFDRSEKSGFYQYYQVLKILQRSRTQAFYDLVAVQGCPDLYLENSKYDSGRLKQYTKNPRNFHKISAFRPEVYLEVFQVQIRTTL